MLKPDELVEAVQKATKDAGRCTRFCVVAGMIEGEQMAIHHNGVGPSDSDMQVIYATAMLNLNKDALAARLAAWITGLHTGLRVNLNEGG